MSSGLSDTEAEAGRESGTREGLKVPSGSIVLASMSTDGLAQKGAGRVSRCNRVKRTRSLRKRLREGGQGGVEGQKQPAAERPKGKMLENVRGIW